MKREDIRKFQLTQLELLKYIDRVCHEQGFIYYLVWGSLIGAIREHGFIPWDADIDIAMKREDYDHFCRFMMDHPSEKLFLDHYLTDEHHISPHALLRIKGTGVYLNPSYSFAYHPKCNGIYIDIFPIDTVPDDVTLQKKQIKKIMQIRTLISYKNAPIYGNRTSTVKRILKKAVSFALRPISLLRLNQKLDEAYQMYSHIESNTVSILTDPEEFPRQTFPKNTFNGVRICKFENMDFIVPPLSETFLKIKYGDYMKLPPVKGRYHFLDEVIDHVDYGIYENGFSL